MQINSVTYLLTYLRVLKREIPKHTEMRKGETKSCAGVLENSSDRANADVVVDCDYVTLAC